MARTVVKTSGAGIGKIYPGQPIMSISDSLFIFDLNTDSLDALKSICGEEKWNNVTVYQIQVYADKTEFESALVGLIRYAIFENQDLLDKTHIICKSQEFAEISNKVWPEQQRAITKFRGRKWPDDKLVKCFETTEGCFSVSPGQDKLDMNDLVSWFAELGYGEETTMDYSGPFDGDEDTPREEWEEHIPIPLEDGAELVEGEPPQPDPDSSGGDDEGGGGVLTEPIVNYYYKHEVTSFPLQENHASPMGSLTSSFSLPQNTVFVDVIKMVRAEVIFPPEPEGGESGGGGE